MATASETLLEGSTAPSGSTASAHLQSMRDRAALLARRLSSDIETVTSNLGGSLTGNLSSAASSVSSSLSGSISKLESNLCQ